MCMLQTHVPAIFYNPRGTYDVIVFILKRFRPSALIRYVCVFVLIHFQERFQIDAFSMKTLSAFECGRGRSDSYNSPVIKKSSQDKCIAHCLFSGFRVPSHLPPRWLTTFPAVFFCRWINERHGYIITQESVIKYGIPPRQETAPAINSWPTVCKGNIYNTIWTTIRDKQTRENNKKRINGIIIIVISDLCATFRATSNKTGFH